MLLAFTAVIICATEHLVDYQFYSPQREATSVPRKKHAKRRRQEVSHGMTGWCEGCGEDFTFYVLNAPHVFRSRILLPLNDKVFSFSSSVRCDMVL